MLSAVKHLVNAVNVCTIQDSLSNEVDNVIDTAEALLLWVNIELGLKQLKSAVVV